MFKIKREIEQTLINPYYYYYENVKNLSIYNNKDLTRIANIHNYTQIILIMKCIYNNHYLFIYYVDNHNTVDVWINIKNIKLNYEKTYEITYEIIKK